MNNRLNDTEERKNNLKDTMVEITQAETAKKKKRF